MRVKSVIKEFQDKRYVVQFEHVGVVWEKFLPVQVDEITLKNWLNSVIEDTITRTR